MTKMNTKEAADAFMEILEDARDMAEGIADASMTPDMKGTLDAIRALSDTLRKASALEQSVGERERPFVSVASLVLRDAELLSRLPEQQMRDSDVLKAIRGMRDALDAACYAYKTLREEDGRLFALARDAAVSFVAGLVGIGVCAWICCLCFGIQYHLRYSIGAYFAALMLQFAVKGFQNTGDRKDED